MILMLYMYRLRTYRTKVMICSHRGEWRSQRASDNNNTRVLVRYAHPRPDTARGGAEGVGGSRGPPAAVGTALASGPVK